MKQVHLALAIAMLISSLGFGASELDPVSEETVSHPMQSPLRFGLDLKYLPAQFPELSGARGKGGQIAFEWIPLADYSRFMGKPAIGISVAGAHIPNFIPGSPHGKLTVYPLSVYLAYRLDFFENQVLVPFAKVGRAISLLSRPLNGAYRYDSWDYSLGGEFCLNAIDSRSARQLDASTGINGTYLVVEWIKSIGNRGSAQPRLAREEWQIGLRFEM